MKTRRSLSVVIPAFNEEARLPRTLRDIRGYLERRGHDGEIVVVDDGSGDRTRDAALGPGVRLVRFETNHGKGFAVREGVLRATREAVLFCDADGSTPIEDVERLWPWLDRGCEVAIASRAMAASRIEVPQPAHRQVMGRIFNAVIGLAGLRGLRDTQCGFKLFTAAAARRLFEPLRTAGFAFDVEILLRARRLGFRVAEVPVRWRDDADSRVRPGRDALGMLAEVLRMKGRP